MDKLLIFSITITLFASCSSTNSAEENIVDKMNLQEECWNNGDLECFMLPYWNSESLLFVNPNGVLNGYNETLLRYRRTYPDKESMGNLQFDIERILMRSETIYQVIGRYHLKRSIGDLEGRYSLIWQLIDGEWVIVSDTTF